MSADNFLYVEALKANLAHVWMRFASDESEDLGKPIFTGTPEQAIEFADEYAENELLEYGITYGPTLSAMIRLAEMANRPMLGEVPKHFGPAYPEG